ncbi:MAG: aminotransferase [Chloroflexi bacterium]|nr:aminotransferase [Chloroflexota bacterium]MDL1943437.1 aminotransferase class V-fold PLP-dependent enzyme [Chloroflexi bacterium CFX2]
MFGLKKYFLLDPSVTFLNHGSYGATPKPVFREYQRWQRELERQPVEFLGRRHNDLMQAAREALAEYLGARAENVVYTQNVTIALNIVARSLELGAGDEVLSTNHEYGAMDRTWRFLSKERGFTYINQPVDLTSQDALVESFWRGVTPRTRVIFLSHLTSPTASILPVERIIQRARANGILTVIDGAHAPGQLPLHLDALGADFYGGNLHKWLCAPKGAGFLYARSEARHLLKPLVVSWGYEAEVSSGSPFIDHHEWWGTRDIAAFLAVPMAIQFQQDHDWVRVRGACHQLAMETRERIHQLTRTNPLHPLTENWFAQMTVASLPADTDIAALKARLYDEYKIEIPLIEWHGNKLIRLSVQGYNSRRDVDRLTAALGKLMA